MQLTISKMHLFIQQVPQQDLTYEMHEKFFCHTSLNKQEMDFSQTW